MKNKKLNKEKKKLRRQMEALKAQLPKHGEKKSGVKETVIEPPKQIDFKPQKEEPASKKPKPYEYDLSGIRNNLKRVAHLTVLVLVVLLVLYIFDNQWKWVLGI